ncbi:transposase family protein [Streptomyces sp. NPDC058953]|uniref:transposase family protein n=1 Tax=unclassified Streptomyces TaxID=2593676 RepID=UPI0036CECDBC
MVENASRAVIVSNRRITGLSADVIAELISEVGPLWHERHQVRLASKPRRRALGAGAKHRLVFVDRLLATLVHLRHGVTHDVLAGWFGVDRSTITRAIGEVRPLLAERGCTVSPDVRLRSLAEVVDHLGASGKTGIVDGTEIRVRRPAAGRKDRDRFISGKNKQNAVKSMVVTDGEGRVLWCSPARPASCADITHARQLGLVKLLADGPAVEILADAGYQGLGAQTGGRMVTPPHRKFKKDAPDWYEEMYERQRKAHSSRRIRGRARHRPPEELAGTGPPPRPPRAHERHRPGRRRPAVPPTIRRPGRSAADVNTEPRRTLRRLTANHARARYPTARRVRRAAWGNGLTATSEPRPRPTHHLWNPRFRGWGRSSAGEAPVR